jgi:hypothetical protein
MIQEQHILCDGRGDAAARKMLEQLGWSAQEFAVRDPGHESLAPFWVKVHELQNRRFHLWRARRFQSESTSHPCPRNGENFLVETGSGMLTWQPLTVEIHRVEIDVHEDVFMRRPTIDEAVRKVVDTPVASVLRCGIGQERRVGISNCPPLGQLFCLKGLARIPEMLN